MVEGADSEAEIQKLLITSCFQYTVLHFLESSASLLPPLLRVFLFSHGFFIWGP